MSRKKNTPKENEQGKYIMIAMDAINKTGDIYTYEDDLLQACREENSFLPKEEFLRDLRFLMKEKLLHKDGRRIYVQYDWAYQCEVAIHLSDMLSSNNLPVIDLPEPLIAGEITLTAEQRQAVALALQHRISIILGGAGTGKSTLVTALSLHRPREGSDILCAPTGKAARI